MAAQQPEKPRRLPNPYAAKGLPNPYARATVAQSAPVRFSEEQRKTEQKKTPASAFHNPHQIKRPQAKGSIVRKPTIARPVMSSSSSDAAPAITTSQQPGLDWWRSTEDDDVAALDWKQQRNKVQKERKKQEKKFAKQFGWWKGEAPYKADKPSNLRAYRANGGYRYKLDSFQYFLENLHVPPRVRKNSSDQSRSSRPASSDSSKAPASGPKYSPPPASDSQNIPPPPPGSGPYVAVPPPPPPPEAPDAIPPPPPPSSAPYNPTTSTPPVRYNPTISAPPVHYGSATVSAPPVRYNVPDTQVNDDLDRPSPDERPAKRPRVSKAEAMMAKMGYVKGQGLGKNSDGITTHLEVKARKHDRRVAVSDDYDDDQSKNIKSQQVFDILGGYRAKQKEPDRFGNESKVVVAWGCVDGVDWAADADRDDGGIRQEMGQTFDNKFGRVERIFVNMSSTPQTVYMKFASELSALNAVNRFHEGYQFRGRIIHALYYNEAKFEASIFDH